MRPQFIIGYILTAVLVSWSLVSHNYEFMIYAAAVLVSVLILHFGDTTFSFASGVLWAFIVWIVLHIGGGLLPVGDGVLYSKVLIPIIGEPYSLLKYDQVVHTYCYTVITLLLWPVVTHIAKTDAGHKTLIFITVLAASGIGGINEIIEFSATVLVPDTNVGNYENNAIDIVANLIGALLAIPFLKKS